ncbi:phenylalanine--tRNA ligase subunit beta [Candidatus Izemoplasma sp. B36]|uniref:phenylalanine--tRNA ligase subunit beta n=1 Tax=Candidatus Izemoplasma sp. B36 TaxID=3242468 RepID=UPI003559259E
MKVSLNWLKEYVDIEDNYKLLEDKFNLMSQEVESLYKLVEATNLVIGHVLTCEKHPDAQKLSVTTVDVGQEKPLQIICGAPNIDKDQKVIVALNGAVLPGNFKIKKAKIRGVESNGMICSLDELGVKDFDASEDGIYVLGADAVVGEDPLKYLALDDYTLDLDLTANRPDLLSMEGVAYDTACMLDKEITLKEHKYDKDKEDNNFSVYTDTSKCLAYYGQIISNIKIKESPYWLKSRLLAVGIRPINNVVDITNYVMIEYGQPLHAFDYDKLNSDRILVRKAKPNEVLKTLDEQERELLEDDIVISTKERAVALAGVMGGFDTEVDDSTTKILLESAYFDPISVRKTSKRLDLKSESSSRFEKGVDPNKLVKALEYATELFIKLADGVVIGNYSFFDNTRKEPHEVELSLEKLNLITGNNFTTQEVEEILKRLRFKNKHRNDVFIVEIPTRRQNVYGYQDLVEEIVRIHGYDKIPTSIPETPTYGYLTKIQKLRRVVKNYFVNLGFNETVTYSLVKDEEVKEFDVEDESVVTLMNPLNKEKSSLRHSLIPSLINVLSYNKSRKMQDVFLFEIGRGYTEEKEAELLSGLMHGLFNSSLWQGKKEIVDYYLLKGILEGLLKKLKIENYEIIKAKNIIKSMHPGIYAELYINNKYVGFLGKLHPQKEHNVGINKTYVFELMLEALNENYNLDLVMNEIPKYPAVTRDLAIVLDKDIMIETLLKEVKKAGKKTLKSVDIFDVYQGENIDDDKKSVALSLVLQSNEKTLETKEVDIVINRILKQLETSLNAVLR